MNQFFSVRKNRVISLIVLMVTSLIIFYKLVYEIFAEKSSNFLDQQVINWAYSLRSPALNEIFKFITTLANIQVIIVIIVIVLVLLTKFNQRKFVVSFLITSVFSIGFTTLAKMIFARERPAITNALISESSFSFPSGHALLSASIYGFLIVILIKSIRNNSARILIYIFGFALIGLIGFSRIYLGVHWPTDILASYAIGIVWLAFSLIALEYKPEITTYVQQLIKKVRK